MINHDMNTAEPYKAGKVAIVGRPNVGKSTLLNALVLHKVAIVSPKPQTTRSQIVAHLEEERGQLFFLDTPGYYSTRSGATHFNALVSHTIEEADVVIYVVDHTRDWGQEEEKIWNMIQASEKPVILAINKTDITSPTYKDSYIALLKPHVQEVVEVSAQRETHIKSLINLLFTYLPLGERDDSVDYFPTPLLSQDSKEYLAELVREKIYQLTGQEVPYQTSVRIESVEEDDEKNTLLVKGKILVSDKRYKPMLIGKQGRKINEIKSAVRKELHVATGKSISVSLQVDVE